MHAITGLATVSAEEFSELGRADMRRLQRGGESLRRARDGVSMLANAVRCPAGGSEADGDRLDGTMAPISAACPVGDFAGARTVAVLPVQAAWRRYRWRCGCRHVHSLAATDTPLWAPLVPTSFSAVLAGNVDEESEPPRQARYGFRGAKSSRKSRGTRERR